ncbi:MAG: SEC-C domain-containing protein [Bryobacterales bacterium]|nr:SEC-C domain-containing protein [Bryobacterales bacterium]
MEDTLYAGLSPAQAQVALSLASGASLSHAAKSSGVGRTTVYTWLKENSAFSAAVDHAKAEYVAALRDRVRDLSAKAIHTIDTLLDDPSVHPSVRLRAALAVLNRPHFPDQGWHLPEKINHPDDEAALENLAQLEFSHRQTRYAQTVLDHIVEAEHARFAALTQRSTVPPAREGTQPNTSEQQTQPVRPTPRPGRNEPCPCGSGLKFKRCCLNKPHAAR